MNNSLLSLDRRWRALSVAASATVLLYLMGAFVAEPLRGLAATTSSSNVTVAFNGQISLECDGDGDATTNETPEVLDLSTLSSTNSDTGVYADARAIYCWVSTNNSAGYTLAWNIDTGSGGTLTGHLVSQFEDNIEPIGAQGSAETTPIAWSVGAADSRWGVTVSTNSGSDPLGFGTNAANDVWARVSTGSSITFGETTAPSQIGDGDLYRIGVRVAVGGSKIQPSGTYYVGDIGDNASGIRFTSATK